ncbi:MAG: hypothetical protein V1752_03820, partial [Candidatus Firestonebacteria bacterium]
APGISGHTMEGRIPLYLLEYIDTAYISVESAYAEKIMKEKMDKKHQDRIINEILKEIDAGKIDR